MIKVAAAALIVATLAMIGVTAFFVVFTIGYFGPPSSARELAALMLMSAPAVVVTAYCWIKVAAVMRGEKPPI